MSYEIKRGRLDEWRRWNWQSYAASEKFWVRVSCARCGGIVTIHNVDLIDDNGQIKTVVKCPRSGCDWQENNVKLMGWNPCGP